MSRTRPSPAQLAADTSRFPIQDPENRTMEPTLSTIATWTRTMVAKLTRRRAEKDVAAKLYGDVVRQARRPEFYIDCGVPDTAQGRFEMIALHAFLVLHRLKRDRGSGTVLAQGVFDTMFMDMDRNLREMGTGDLGVGRRVKALAQSFYGCISAYEAGLEGGDEVLSGALKRNLYGNVNCKNDCLMAMMAYLRREALALDGMELDRLQALGPGFGEPPQP